MEKWSNEWVESVIELLHDPYGDYDRMRKELKEQQAGGGSMTQNEK